MASVWKSSQIRYFLKINLLHFQIPTKGAFLSEENPPNSLTQPRTGCLILCTLSLPNCIPHSPFWHSHHVHHHPSAINHPHHICPHTIIPLEHTCSHTIARPPQLCKPIHSTYAIGLPICWSPTQNLSLSPPSSLLFPNPSSPFTNLTYPMAFCLRNKSITMIFR